MTNGEGTAVDPRAQFTGLIAHWAKTEPKKVVDNVTAGILMGIQPGTIGQKQRKAELPSPITAEWLHAWLNQPAPSTRKVSGEGVVAHRVYITLAEAEEIRSWGRLVTNIAEEQKVQKAERSARALADLNAQAAALAAQAAEAEQS